MMWGLVTAVRAVTIAMIDIAGSEITITVRQLGIANDININININNASIAVVVASVLPCPALCVLPSGFDYSGNQE